jgi:hypothetical protein
VKKVSTVPLVHINSSWTHRIYIDSIARIYVQMVRHLIPDSNVAQVVITSLQVRSSKKKATGMFFASSSTVTRANDHVRLKFVLDGFGRGCTNITPA